MIKHIVMWKFKEEAEGCSKAENIAKVKAMLEKDKKGTVDAHDITVGSVILDN